MVVAEDLAGAAVEVMALGEGAEAVEDLGVVALAEDLEVLHLAIMEEDEKFSSENKSFSTFSLG